MAKKIRSLLKSIYKSVWLGLLTLFLVTVIFPATAQSDCRGGFSRQFLILKDNLSCNTDINGQDIKGEIIALNQQNNANLSLLAQGRMLFVNGRFAEAVTVWQQAAKGFEVEGDRSQLALTLNEMKVVMFTLIRADTKFY